MAAAVGGNRVSPARRASALPNAATGSVSRSRIGRMISSSAARQLAVAEICPAAARLMLIRCGAATCASAPSIQRRTLPAALRRRRALLGHLMLQIGDDDRDTSLHHRQDDVVFAGEVSVERLVRRARLG